MSRSCGIKRFFSSETVTLTMRAIKYREGKIDSVVHNYVSLSLFPHVHFKIWTSRWHESSRFLNKDNIRNVVEKEANKQKSILKKELAGKFVH